MTLRAKALAMTVGLAAAAALAGCSASHAAAARKRSPAFADPQCPAVLAVIPANPPGTASQAGTLSKELGTDLPPGSQLRRGTLLRSLAFRVGDDSFKLVFDLTGLTGNASADLAAYNSDVAQLRQYCRG